MQLIFGIGAFWGQRTDVAGVGPDQFAILQENSVDFSFEVKELYSQLSFPVDIARAKGKISGKAKMARVFGQLYADIFFGAVPTSTIDTVSEDEIGTIPNLTPFTVTVAFATSFVADLGVYFGQGSGNPGGRLESVTSPNDSGDYSANPISGVYTFSSADAGKQVKISYIYTQATGGLQTNLTNNYMGYTPTFVGTFYQNRATQGSGGQLTLRLNQCVSSRLTLPSRLDDYAVPDLDWMAFADASNNIGTLSTTE